MYCEVVTTDCLFSDLIPVPLDYTGINTSLAPIPAELKGNPQQPRAGIHEGS